ncbi:hypothetical protein SAMN06273570_1071 [Candidatus Pantoea floridensis]|uniref:Uncharacterized protein n=1 Tax=Candidatus Pantoea floridensis TaxID=1938870 RepID=A0A286BRM5_9GAMM|nr:hypothetical protein BX596_2748 [Enterobacteriaceae bacterium JKS000233]SOD36758.1 hypothetical protein SAMN06273570_1071 [Pantoea floridensis]
MRTLLIAAPALSCIFNIGKIYESHLYFTVVCEI